MGLSDLRRQWREISLEKRISLVGGLIVAPMIVAVGAPLIVGAIQGATTPVARPTVQLEVINLAVTDGIDTPQALDITVRNTGDTVSVVTGVALTVRDFGLIQVCEAGGALEASGDYDLELPVQPAVGDVVEAKVSQQILADEADRFALRLTVPASALQDGLRLYALDVGLRHDAGDVSVPAGMAVVAVPLLPAPLMFDQQYAAANQDDIAACYRKNAATLERHLALDAARADGLDDGLLRGVSGLAPPAAATDDPVASGVAAPGTQALFGTVEMFTGLAEAEGLVCSEFEAGIACNSETDGTWLAIITADGERIDGLTVSAQGAGSGPPDLIPEAAFIATVSNEAMTWANMSSPGTEGVTETFNGLEIQLSETDGIWFMMVGTVGTPAG